MKWLQFITFGFACTPLYFVWEKVIGMHDTRSICLRALVRLPVVIPIWFLAIIFPFFGPINSAVGALLVSFTVYIIPALAHMLTYRKASARQVNFFIVCFTSLLLILLLYKSFTRATILLSHLPVPPFRSLYVCSCCSYLYLLGVCWSLKIKWALVLKVRRGFPHSTVAMAKLCGEGWGESAAYVQKHLRLGFGNITRRIG